jgi:transcriptional regulator with XRE-family HTH domain
MAFAQERDMAEKALSYDGPDALPPFPPVAARIRAARTQLGISETEVARRLGVEPSMYWDLEWHDDELFMCVDFDRLPELAAVLETSLLVLLFGEEPREPPTRVSYAEVAQRIANRIGGGDVTVEELSEAVGWELRPILDNPAALGTYNIAGVHDVCQAVGVDWVGLLR